MSTEGCFERTSYATILKKHIFFLFFIAISCVVTPLVAQTDTLNKIGFKKDLDTTVVSGHSKVIESKKIYITKHVIPLDSEFVVNNKRFRYYNNWLTVGGGWQQNLTYKRKLGFVGGVDLNIHIKQYYFQIGPMISGEQYGYYNDYQLHLCYGKRYENKTFQFAVFGGPAYSIGFAKVGDTVYTRKFDHFGLYAEGEVVKKVTYDVGIGASFYADWNQEQTILGLKLMLYFSGSYLGKKYMKQEED